MQQEQAGRHNQELCFYQNIAGVDEAGRGPLIGPVVAAAVILDPNKPIDGLNDSKKLSEKKREALFDEIKAHALSYAIAFVDSKTIDEINILQATMLAMKQSVEQLPIQPDYVQVDGNRLPKWKYQAEAVVKGDGKIQAIGAASILAKVSRDRYMKEMAQQYPQYQLDKHKGYGTKAHMEALQEHGVLPEHRMSFRPVREAAERRS